MPECAGEVLIVDDNLQDVELIRHALERRALGHRVCVANNGVEALELLAKAEGGRQRLPRLVILDVKLPLVDGLAILRRVRSSPLTRHLVVVMLSSSGERQDVEASYRFGANSYVVKPVEYDAFVDLVGRLADYWLVVNQPFVV